MGIRIIAEVGSTHAGKITYGKEIIDKAIDADADAIKFQLFPNREEYTKSGNVYLKPEIFLELLDYASEQGIPCSASVFDDDSLDFLIRTRPPFIKFAFSQRHRLDWIEKVLLEDIEAIVSCDVMSDRLIPREATKLYCIPKYPVPYIPNFDGIFPRFDGFSDHTLGFDQTLESIYAGAKIIEKHVTLQKMDITCPDSFFALSIPEFMSMCQCIRQLEMGKTLG